jgi:hypothetical protein
MKNSHLSLNVFGGASFLSFAHRNESLFSCYPLLMVFFVAYLKDLFFITIARLFNDTLILAFDRNFHGVVNVLCFL